ncbi:MAG: imidazole glycerol phosphate synthase subunit HisH [Alphaproteobacteria bacterium]
MSVAIIDYGSGNLRSVEKAFARAVGDQAVSVISDGADVAAATHLVLPGVGAFGDCKQGLDALPGMVDAIRAHVAAGKPFLGICVGMQLLAKLGHEHGTHAGLGLIDGEVHPITPADPAMKVPHMGWNEITVLDSTHPVLSALPKGAHCYFANSFAMRDVPANQLLATVEYGETLTAAVGKDNVLGTQFHPEKSQAAGAALIKAFTEWRP